MKNISIPKRISVPISCFLSFEAECRLEIMQMPNIPKNKNDVHQQNMGFIHFAICVGSKEKVDVLTEQLRKMDTKLLANHAQQAMVIMKA